MAITCEIAGSEYLTQDINFQMTESGHSQASVTIVDSPAGTQFWDTIILKQDGVRFFEGLMTVSEFYSPDNFNADENYYTLTAMDYTGLTKYRTVAEVVENTTAGEAVEDYIIPILAEEGVTIGLIEADWEIERDVWSYMYIYDVMESLIQAAPGYIWYIDMDKKFYYYKKSAGEQIYLRDGDQFTNYQRIRDFTSYRNIQHAIVSEMQTQTQPLRVPSPLPDGTIKTFTLNFAIAKEPTIWVNSVQVDPAYIGVNGIDDDSEDSDIQWFWSYGSNTITQASKETALAAGATILVTYIGLRSGVVSHSDYNKIQSRQISTPDLSGKTEHVVNTGSFETISQVSRYISDLIETYGTTANKLTFTTESTRFHVGQRLSVRARNAAYTVYIVGITGVSIDSNMEYTITAIDAAYDGGTWEEYFYKIIVGNRSYTINSTDVLYKTIAIPDSVAVSGSYTLGLSGTGLALPFTLPGTLGGSDYQEVILDD